MYIEKNTLSLSMHFSKLFCGLRIHIIALVKVQFIGYFIQLHAFDQRNILFF